MKELFPYTRLALARFLTLLAMAVLPESPVSVHFAGHHLFEAQKLLKKHIASLKGETP